MNRFYTHLLVKYPKGTKVQIEALSGIKIEIKEGDKEINFFCISSESTITEIGYEKLREQFVERLNSTGCYVSILFDNISAQRHKDISNSIYGLEREFRNLIEIFMLRTKGEGWTDIAAFQNIIKKDKKANREEFVQLLKNPLDDLDFITLREFVNTHICVDNNKTLINKLDILMNKIDNWSDIDKDEINKISEDISAIKEKCVTKKDKEICSDRLYKHLNTRINAQWEKLYRIRNLWAHNNCIITTKEFDEYNNSSQDVLYELRAEMSILLFFEDKQDEYQLIEEDRLKIRINRYKLWGTDNCRFRLIKTDGSNSIVIEKDLFTYMDLINIITEFEVDKEKILVYKENPMLLIEYIKDNYTSVVRTSTLEEIKIKFEKINNKYITNKFNINEETEDACIMAGKVDKCLEEIFSK